MVTAEQEAALEVARGLARVGAPLFLAAPDPSRDSGFALPPGYQRAAPDPTVPDAWRPGWALAMVTGAVLDVVDVDTYAGGQVPAELPRVYAVADTPSGGRHMFVAPLDVASLNGAYPGVDVKAGTRDGSGRGFVFLAPTERPGKVDGAVRPYRWRTPPDAAVLASLGRSFTDSTGALLRGRILDRRERTPEEAPRRVAESAWRRECVVAVEGLAADVARWSATGWGGAAHAGLLASTTRLARLSPEYAEVGFREAFRRAGVEPDERDLSKLESALAAAVPDEVVPDAQLSPQDRFWLGGGFEPPEEPDPPPEGPRHAEVGGFRFLSEEEVEGLPQPERLVDGLLWRDSVARVFGPSGVGKTWVAIDLAAHVANGMSWLGLGVKRGPVLYVAAEGAPSMGPRLRLWRGVHGRRTGVATWPEAVAVLGPNWSAFVSAAADLGPALVVLDTQNAMAAGSRENSNDDAGDVVRALNVLARRTGACVLLVHHTGHDEVERARGASALYAGLDTELQLSERRGGVVLMSRKQRYGRRLAPIPADVEVRGDEGWVLGAAAPAGHFGDAVDDRARELLAVLQEDPRSDPSQSVRTLRERLRGLGHGVSNEKNGPANVAIRLFLRGAGMPAQTVAEDDSADR